MAGHLAWLAVLFVYEIICDMATFGRGRGIRTRGGRTFNPGFSTRYSRYDTNFLLYLVSMMRTLSKDNYFFLLSFFHFSPHNL